MQRIVETTQPEPIFDPRNYYENLDFATGEITLTGHDLRGQNSGNFDTRVTGRGFKLNGLREYEPGDDANDIDWIATAGEPDGTILVNKYRKEIVPDVMIVTDSFQDVNYFTPGVYNEQGVAASSILQLMHMSNRQGMRSGLIAATQDGLSVMRSSSRGKGHLEQTAELMADVMLASAERNITPESEAERPRLKDLLQFAGDVTTKSLIIVVSNLVDEEHADYPTVGWKDDLDALADKGNEIIVAQITNPFNFAAPTTTDVFSTGGKTFRLGMGKLGAEQRARYAHNAAIQQASIARAVEPNKHLMLSTAEPLWSSSLTEQLRTKA